MTGSVQRIDKNVKKIETFQSENKDVNVEGRFIDLNFIYR